MPIFEYKCKLCNHTLDDNLPDAELFCGECDSPDPMKRVYSFSGTVLKGSGWYSVDKRKADGGKIGLD